MYTGSIFPYILSMDIPDPSLVVCNLTFVLNLVAVSNNLNVYFPVFPDTADRTIKLKFKLLVYIVLPLKFTTSFILFHTIVLTGHPKKPIK